MTPEVLPDAVDEIVAAYLDDLDRGQAAPRAVWLARHPEHAEALAGFLDDLACLSPPTAHNATAPNNLDATIADLSQSAAPPTPVPNEIAVQGGQVGDYQLLDVVARGGMGVVFKARHRQLDRVVALKMILTGPLASAQDVERFRAEAQAAAGLDHPHIVPIHDVGEHRGLHYFTMAFIDGASLAERLRDGPLDPRSAALLIRDLALALDYAHRQGVIHRDLKPANVLLDRNGQPKLTDFGLAKRTEGTAELTGTGQVLGTPAYMAPEQAEGLAVGPAADVYGLGALLFALLTGRPPFQAATVVETIRQVVAAEPPHPQALNPSVPRDLNTICLKCLQKAPPRRYASAADLAADLDRFLDDRPILARPVGVVEKAYRWYRRRPVVGTMALALVLLFLAVPALLAGMWVEAEGRAEAEARGREQEAEARKKVEAAERERARQLFGAYVNEAAARRTSTRVGRGYTSLERIVTACDLADELRLPAEEYTRLRSEAISALSLTDLRTTKNGPGWFLKHDPNTYRYVQANDCYLSWDRPDGLLVRRVGDNRVIQRMTVECTDGEKHYVQISPDNRFVSSQVNGKVTVWRVDGDKPREVTRHEEVVAAHFAPDRDEIILYTPARDVVIQPLDGKTAATTVRIPELTKEPNPHPWLGARPGPRRQVAVGGNGRVLLADLSAGKVTATFPVPGPVEHLVWSADGATVAASCKERGVTLYHVASNTPCVVPTTPGGPECLCFEPGGRYLLAVNEWTSYGALLDVAGGAAVLRFHQSELSAAPLHRVPAWWQGMTAGCHRILPLAPADGLGLYESAVHPAGRLLITPAEHGLVFSDLGTGERVGFLPLENGSRVPRVDNDGDLFLLHIEAGGVILPSRRDVRREGNRYTLGAPERFNLPAAWLDVSADGRTVAVGAYSDGATVLDRQTGKRVALQPQRDVRRVAVSPDGALVATFGWGENAAGFRVWEAATGKLAFVHDKGYHSVGRFTPDGKHLVTFGAEEAGLNLWSVPECKFVRTLGPLGTFAVSPDSRYVAVAELTGRVRLTRIADGALVARFDAPGEGYVTAPLFSSDGRYLVCMNVERNRLHVWDLWKLRRQLAALKLDWEKTSAPEPVEAREPLVLEIAPQERNP